MEKRQNLHLWLIERYVYLQSQFKQLTVKCIKSVLYFCTSQCLSGLYNLCSVQHRVKKNGTTGGATEEGSSPRTDSTYVYKTVKITKYTDYNDKSCDTCRL